MSKRITWRPIAAVVVLIATVAVFVDYFATHPAVRHILRQTSVGTLALLIGLYILFVGSLALINSATLRLTNTNLGSRESLLLTMYSSVINFFGPLQSGPAFRALYLKKRHSIKLKDYSVATLMYYGFYALFSGLFLLSGLLGWWLIPLFVASIMALTLLARARPAYAERFRKLNLSNWYFLAFATLLQVSIQVIIYYVELHSILPGVHFGQVVVYTGAANFALFVSLTPGAIGFRESFLLFSEKLHHIHNGTIVLANTIDRAAYISVLVLAAIVIFSTHAQKRLTAVTKPLS